MAGVDLMLTIVITMPPVPLALVGSTVCFRRGFRDQASGEVYDSELVSVEVL
jgi:hypothetical protein